MPTPSPIGRRIAAVRRDRGLSQRELAEASGVAQCAIAAWEQGVRAVPRLPLLRRIARALGLTLEQLIKDLP